MKHSLLTLTLSPFIALLIVTLVGAGATYAVLRSIDLSAEYAAYYPGI